MEAAVASVGKSVLNCLLSGAKAAIDEDVASKQGVQRGVTFLTDELAEMQRFLIAADEERNRDRVPRSRVKQTRDLALDVEDCLQDYVVHLEKPSWWHLPRTRLERHRIAEEMKGLRARVEDTAQRNERYRLVEDVRSRPPVVVAAVQSSVTAADAFSVSGARRQHDDKAKLDLVRLIDRMDGDLGVIAVWGKSISDLGQMSFIKRAYEDPKIHKKFECRAWITELMRPFNSTEFMKSVVEQFYLNLLQEAGEDKKATLGAQVLKIMGMTKEDDLAHEFKQYLNERSYLIVLNGIHTIQEWDHIKPCFPDNKKGSRIIVSTEQVGVASLCIEAGNGAPDHKELFSDQTLHVFYGKGSQDGTNSAEAGSSSNVVTTGVNNLVHNNILTRVETLVAASLEESRLIGRGSEKYEIIKLVSNKDVEQLRVISLWGMGGIGKTTLVRDIYQSDEISGMFDKRACVTVMRPFNCSELLKSLTMQFGYNDVEDLRRYLEGKTYLLVIDDVSSTLEWDAIIQHLPNATASCIIVTTRKENIANHCSKDQRNIRKLNSLSHDDARILFTKKIFKETIDMDEQYPELVEQAELILRKCNGLPLAIVTIGGFLANQPRTALEWKKLNEHINAELEMNPELGTIRTVLIRSCDDLPYYLKSCFLYMPIFPEDHIVGRGRLVRRWSAEGYSREVRGKSAEEILDSYFMELLSRSIILPSQKSIHSTKGIDSCQVHDLIREIGISKSMEENLVFRLDEGSSLNTKDTARHLAINGNWEGDKDEFESMVDMSRVRSITVFGKWRSFFMSDKMSLLRVLDLEDTIDLYDRHLKHIGKFLHLRYLSLRGCYGIFHLPNSLGNLRQLETLDIRGTRIVMLPKTIIKLQKLINLRSGRKPADEDVSRYEFMEELPRVIRNRLCLLPLLSVLLCFLWCAPQIHGHDDRNRRDICTMGCCHVLPSVAMHLDMYGVVVPRGMRKLKALQILGVVNIARGKAVVQDIKRLTRLRKLAVTGVNKENGQGLCSAVAGLRRLESLSIRSEGEPGLCGCLDGMPSPPENLQSLKLFGNLVELPEWIQKLKNLVKLKLRSTMLSDADTAMKVLGSLPNLASLQLLPKSFQRGEGFCLNFHAGKFPSLVVLELARLKPMKFEEGATPKLELLKFWSVDINSESLWGIPSLSSLKEVVLQGNYEPDELEYLRTERAKNLNRPTVRMV